jgi:hypothetical protein
MATGILETIGRIIGTTGIRYIGSQTDRTTTAGMTISIITVITGRIIGIKAIRNLGQENRRPFGRLFLTTDRRVGCYFS